MAAPRLSTVQRSVAELITASAAKSGSMLAGIPVAREEFGYMDPTGTETNSDAVINAALGEDGPGLAIFVSQPMGTLEASTVNGRSEIKASCVAFLLVNPEQNERGTSGLNRNPLLVVEELWASVPGKSIGPSSFQIGASALGISEDGAAIRTYPVEFICTLIV